MIILITLLIIVLCIVILGGYVIFANTLDMQFKMPGSKEDDGSSIDGPNDLMRPTAKKLYAYQEPLKKEFNDLPFKELEVTSFDGLKLKGYLLQGNPKEVVILAHGYKSSRENDFCDKIKIYLERNSTVLAVDERAHGNSDGRYIGFSELDRFDIAKWVDKINELYDNPDIYLHGVSMGGATVIHCANMNLKNVKGIVDDCGYDTISNITKALIGDMFHLPYFPLGTTAGVIAKIIAGIDFDKSNGEECVKNTDIPIVFIHGSMDHFVPCEMSKRMYENCASACELLIVDKAGHAASYMMASEEYTAVVNRLLNKEIS